MRRSSRCEDMKSYIHFPVKVGEPRSVIDTLHKTLHIARNCSKCSGVITCTNLQSYLSILHSICISAATAAATAAVAAAATATTATAAATLATPVVVCDVCSPLLHQSFYAILSRPSYSLLFLLSFFRYSIILLPVHPSILICSLFHHTFHFDIFQIFIYSVVRPDSISYHSTSIVSVIS